MDYKKLSADFGITGLQESLKTISEFFGEEPTRLLLATNFSDNIGIDLGFATIWKYQVEYKWKDIVFSNTDYNYRDEYCSAPLRFVNKLAEAIKGGTLFKIVAPEADWGVVADYVIAPSVEMAPTMVGDYVGKYKYVLHNHGDPF